MRSWGWGLEDGISVLTAEEERLRSALSRSPACWEHSKEGATRRPGRGLYCELLDVSASRTVRNKCLRFKPSGLWHFVIVAWADRHTSLKNYCLTHELFKSVMFHFQIFGDFPDIFLWLISRLIPFWSENILCLISVLLNLFNLKDMVCFGEYFMCTWEEYVLVFGRWENHL